VELVDVATVVLVSDDFRVKPAVDVLEVDAPNEKPVVVDDDAASDFGVPNNPPVDLPKLKAPPVVEVELAPSWKVDVESAAVDGLAITGLVEEVGGADETVAGLEPNNPPVFGVPNSPPVCANKPPGVLVISSAFDSPEIEVATLPNNPPGLGFT